jgi:hypothetical protein
LFNTTTHNDIKKIRPDQIYDGAIESPLAVMNRLVQRLNNRALPKCEDLPPLFLFLFKRRELSVLRRDGSSDLPAVSGRSESL